MTLRRSLLVFAAAASIVACSDPTSVTPGASGATSGAIPAASRSSTPSPTISPENVEEALAAARERFMIDPPTIHGVYELREANEPEPVRWEVWVRMPAFRVETTFQGEPLVINTEDGERLGIRQGDDVSATGGLGEMGAIMIAPVVQFFDLPVLPCASQQVLGTEEVAGRHAIHIACPEDESEAWVDPEYGLILASLLLDPGGPGGETSTGFTSIEFDPQLDDALFDPLSV